jgi:hypothetical protein
VLAIGILHHLSDEEALKLFRLAQSALKPGGCLVTLDGCYIDNQPRLARYLISKDRGEHIRTLDAYRALASRVFSKVVTHLRSDLLHVPYTHLIMKMEK